MMMRSLFVTSSLVRLMEARALIRIWMKGTGADSHGGVQRRWNTGVPASGHKLYKRIMSSNENLPLEILRMLSDWFAVLEERGTVPGTSLGGMIGTIAALEECLSGLSTLCVTPLFQRSS